MTMDHPTYLPNPTRTSNLIRVLSLQHSLLKRKRAEEEREVERGGNRVRPLIITHPSVTNLLLAISPLLRNNTLLIDPLVDVTRQYSFVRISNNISEACSYN